MLAQLQGEGEVRVLLGRVWNEPKDAQELIGQLVAKNASVFEFERELEAVSRQVTVVGKIAWLSGLRD